MNIGSRFEVLPIAAADPAETIDLVVENGAAGTVSRAAGLTLIDRQARERALSVSSSGVLRGADGTGDVRGASAGMFVVNSEAGETVETARFSKLTVASAEGDEESITIAADVVSPSVTGTAAFTIRPQAGGEPLTVEVRLALQFKLAVARLGVSPLRSMFLFGAGNRAAFDDYRPSVHASDGLWMRSGEGQIGWRSLNNPPVVANAYFANLDPSAFGLIQRQRDFSAYQDADAHYEQRPSIVVTPETPWGHGFVRLVEMPSRQESADNIAAFWMPQRTFDAGSEAEFTYRLTWSDSPQRADELGTVERYSAGRGGASGVENDAALRKFVVDFNGPALSEARMPAGPLDAFVTVSPGQVDHIAISRLPGSGAIRLAIDAKIEGAGPVELRAYLIAAGRQLTETWMFQWHAPQA